jgi:hypothetical protein
MSLKRFALILVASSSMTSIQVITSHDLTHGPETHRTSDLLARYNIFPATDE